MPTDRTDSPAAAWLRLCAAVACFGAALPACEPMESRGDIFSPAPAPRSADPSAPVEADPAFDFPSEPPLVLSSEQLAEGDLASAMATAAGVDTSTLGELPAAQRTTGLPPVEVPVQAVAAPASVGLPAVVQWPVRLVSTLPQAQPPRAILGLPSGEERVVSPGSMLAEQGLVVMAVSGDKVTLARIAPAGDHARIDTIELSAQYTAAAPPR